jgi:hypothetical protein
LPEQSNSTALAITEGEYEMVVKDFDAAGKKTELKFSIPTQQDFGQWSVQQQIGMLKQGQWAACNIPTIIWGLAYAFQIGADPIKGEIFPTGQGRWGTSNKFKIRKAIETGNIVGIQVEMRDTEEELRLEKCVAKTDLECTVTITVKGWSAPIVRKARLSRWYKANNPNWQGNPEHMLELNTVAHACEYVPGVTPVTGDDEAPPTIDAVVVS